MIYIALRVTEAQAKMIDEYRQANGHLGRSAACRLLLARQLRYEAWATRRRRLNLPPFPTSRIQKIEPPEPAEAVRLAEIFQKKYGVDDEDAIARLLLGSYTKLRGLRTQIVKIIRREQRERRNEELERSMNAAVEGRQNAGGNP